MDTRYMTRDDLIYELVKTQRTLRVAQERERALCAALASHGATIASASSAPQHDKQDKQDTACDVSAAEETLTERLQRQHRTAILEHWPKRANEPGFIHLELEWREGQIPEVKDLFTIGFRYEIVYDPLMVCERILIEPLKLEHGNTHEQTR